MVSKKYIYFIVCGLIFSGHSMAQNKKIDDVLVNSTNRATLVGSCLGTTQQYFQKLGGVDDGVEAANRRFSRIFDSIPVEQFAIANDAYNKAIQAVSGEATRQQVINALKLCMSLK